MRHLFLILSLLTSFEGISSPVCKTSHHSLVSVEPWERKEVCMDPYAVICENDNGFENYKKRSGSN